MGTTLETAMMLYELGFSLIPIAKGSKKPTVKWKGYQTQRCTMDDVQRWFMGVSDCSIGVITGKISNIVAVDADDSEAVECVESNCEETEWRNRTARGCHFIYRHPGFVVPNTTGLCNRKIDIRGDGGYIRIAELVGDWTTDATVPTYDPAWLSQSSGQLPPRVVPAEVGSKHPLTRAAYDYLAYGCSENGQRNATLYKIACDFQACAWSSGETLAKLVPIASAGGLSIGEAEETIRSAFKQDRTPTEFPDTDEKQPAPRGARPFISNVVVTTQLSDGERKTIFISRTIEEIASDIAENCDGWPRAVNEVLFVLVDNLKEGELPNAGTVRHLTKADKLTAWLYEQVSFYWRSQGGCVDRQSSRPRTPQSMPVFFEHLSASAKSYRSIEMLPHFPEYQNTFYVPCHLPTSDGSALAELTDRLNPETDEDRQLMVAALATPLWGGPLGARPAFAFTSEHGQGSGKSATAEAFAEVYGGKISVDAPTNKTDWDRIRSRLLDESSLAQRIVMIDNVKGKLASSQLESLITSRNIDGKRMYVGQFSRPNNLTVYLTFNTSLLSRDLAQRCVLIKVGKPRVDQGFVAWFDAWLAKNRPALISDLMALLGRKPSGVITTRDRWQTWQDGVLAHCEAPEALAQLIVDRRGTVDADQEDANDAADAIRAALVKVGLNPQTCMAGISRRAIHTILVDGGALPAVASQQWAGNFLKEKLKVGDLADRLAEVRDRRLNGQLGRYWVWTGENCYTMSEVLANYDDAVRKSEQEHETDYPELA